MATNQFNSIKKSTPARTGRGVVAQGDGNPPAEVSDQLFKAMLENAPSNIIFADTDFRITYVNPASERTLAQLEEHLPVRVDQILGQSIDIFHENPAHQRRILSDPKNLPRQANIRVGPETLDLLVSPIYNVDGEFSGSMVTWEIVTEKLRVETEMAKIKSMMEQAPINVMFANNDLEIGWIRRARLEAEWLDNIEVPLDEPTARPAASTAKPSRWRTR